MNKTWLAREGHMTRTNKKRNHKTIDNCVGIINSPTHLLVLCENDSILFASAKLQLLAFSVTIHNKLVHAQKNLVHERQVGHAPLSTRVIALYYLELHVQSKICVSEIQSFLLLKLIKCVMEHKTGLSRVMKAQGDSR